MQPLAGVCMTGIDGRNGIPLRQNWQKGAEIGWENSSGRLTWAT
jgi:hypothetical protein